MEPMDEMDDVLKALENGENPAKNALQKEKAHDAETAARFRVISMVALALGVVTVAGGILTIGRPVLPLIGAIAGGVLLVVSANAWAASSVYKDGTENMETMDSFKKSSVTMWKCRSCGHTVVSAKVPERCPFCKQRRSYFKVQVENY